VIGPAAQSSGMGAWQAAASNALTALSGVTRPQEELLIRLIRDLRAVVLAPPVKKERFHAVFLDHHRSVLAGAPVGVGDECGLSLKYRELFGKALSVGAHSMIIAHNHPSGDCRPSPTDVIGTKKLASMAKSLEIGLIDHLIFTENAVYSMRGGGEL